MNSWFFRFDTFSQRLCGTVLNSAWQCAPNWSFVGLKDKVYSQIGKVNRRSIVLPEKGARIVALPSSDAKIRGFSRVSLLVVDEASRVPDGDIALVSTPFGKRGFFCQEFLIDAPVGGGR